MAAIQRTFLIEDLVRDYPGSVPFLIERHMPCIVCGEPLWGTLEEVARSRGRSDAEIDDLVDAMNRVLGRKES